VLRGENPAFVRGLTPMQRMSYLTTLLGWFDAWRTLGYLLAPAAVVLTGAVPVTAALPVFLAYFLPAFFLQGLALRLLARGMAPADISTVFDLVRLPANLRATLRLLSRRERGYTLTSKGRTGRKRARVGLPRLHANGSALWLAVNSVLLTVAVRRIRQEWYGAERRAAVRFPWRATRWWMAPQGGCSTRR
jgi:cellulose synthase (UDP-forming)